jgi:hypothetical protein
MSIRLQFGTADEAGFLAVGGQIADDDDGFWAGAQRCFAGVALAVSLAASAFAAQAASRIRQDPEEVPAASLAEFSTPDEDYWQLPQIGQIAQISLALYRCAPYLPDTEEPTPSSPCPPEEDFWSNPVPCSLFPVPCKVYQPLPYLPDPTDDPAGSLHGPPEEDFWDNPVNPVPPTIYQELPYLEDADDVPAGSLHGQPDDDFWANPVAPAAPAVCQCLPYLPDLSDDPAGSLAKFSAPDEDYCQFPQITQITLGIYQPLPIAAGEPAETVPTVLFQPDEDYGPANLNGRQLPTCLLPICQPLPYQPDLSDDPAGSLYGVPEETEWQNPVEQSRSRGVEGLRFSTCRLLDFSTSADEPAGALYGVPEETEWQNPQISRIAQILQLLPYTWSETADILPQVAFVPDEDYWQNPAPPSPPAVVGACRGMPLPYLPDLGDDPAGSLLKFTSPDEDFWDNPVNPVPPVVYQELPYLEDTEEIPAGALYGVPEETEWQNPVEESRSRGVEGLRFSTFRLLDFSTSGDEPAGSLHGVPEEDSWRPQITQIPPCGPKPLGSGPQITPAALQSLAVATGEASEIPQVTALDEDYWQAWAEAQPSFHFPFSSFQFAAADEFASFWWTSWWGVRTHSEARARISHSIARGRLSRSTPRPRVSRGVSRQSRL